MVMAWSPLLPIPPLSYKVNLTVYCYSHSLTIIVTLQPLRGCSCRHASPSGCYNTQGMCRLASGHVEGHVMLTCDHGVPWEVWCGCGVRESRMELRTCVTKRGNCHQTNMSAMCNGGEVTTRKPQGILGSIKRPH